MSLVILKTPSYYKLECKLTESGGAVLYLFLLAYCVHGVCAYGMRPERINEMRPSDRIARF